MYKQPLVPAGFHVPERLDGNGFHLRMLSIDDVDKDFEAVIESADRLKGLLDPQSPWPQALTKKEDMIDLAWHQREFTLRYSFAYTVMSSGEHKCLGCVYIFPSKAASFEAAVFYWVREGDNADAFDKELGNLILQWIIEFWPFKAVAFPGRTEPWDSFQ